MSLALLSYTHGRGHGGVGGVTPPRIRENKLLGKNEKLVGKSKKYRMNVTPTLPEMLSNLSRNPSKNHQVIDLVFSFFCFII